MIIGIVGKPNSGKSTFFKALTLAEVEIANYPFTTIKKNEGIAYVRVSCVEQEFGVKCKPKLGYCVGGQRFIPIKIIDVAGLVPGAHKGKGRGNQFLDDLREADVLIHVLDASGRTDAEGKPTTGYNVLEEVKFLQDEIDLWMHEIIGRNWQRFSRKVHGERMKLSEELAKQLSGLKIREDQIKKVMLELDLSETPLEWTEEHLLEFTRRLRKETKPIIIAANKSDTSESSENLKTLRDFAAIPCSAESELALREAAKHQLIKYVPGNSDFELLGSLNETQEKALSVIKSRVLEKYGNAGCQQVLNEAVFKILKRITVYPVENENKLSDSYGNVLPDALLLPRNSSALNLAEAIHSDIAKNFVAAIDGRSKRRLPRDYVLKNGDVIRILTR
ncbi:MAG: redox-regulated ATPase YchF [Nanoarchaeota archaeon]